MAIKHGSTTYHPNTASQSYRDGYWRLKGCGLARSTDGWDTGQLVVKYQGTPAAFHGAFFDGRPHPDVSGMYAVGATVDRRRGPYTYGTVPFLGVMNLQRRMLEETTLHVRERELNGKDFSPAISWTIAGKNYSSVRVSSVQVGVRRTWVSQSPPSTAGVLNLQPGGSLPVRPSREILAWLSNDITYIHPNGWVPRAGTIRKHPTAALYLIEIDWLYEHDTAAA